MIAIIARDLSLAFRSGGSAGLGIAFFLTVVLMIPFGTGPDPELHARLAPGMLWVAALLACLLSLDRLFLNDFEDGTLDALATSPIPLEGVVIAKAIAHWLSTGLPLVIIAPLLAMMLNMPLEGYVWLPLSLLIGTPALSFLGAIGAALTVGIKRGGLLLSLLTLPLYIPSLIFGTQMIMLAIDGLENTNALLFHLGITLFTIALTPFVAATALRISST